MAKSVMSGGAREGAGRKNSWASQTRKENCKLIRVPEYIADKMVQIAHYVDAGGEVNTSQFEKVALSENNKFEGILDIISQHKLKSKPAKGTIELITQLEGYIKNNTSA
jgi:hypothetical protein